MYLNEQWRVITVRLTRVFNGRFSVITDGLCYDMPVPFRPRFPIDTAYNLGNSDVT